MQKEGLKYTGVSQTRGQADLHKPTWKVKELNCDVIDRLAPTGRGRRFRESRVVAVIGKIKLFHVYTPNEWRSL